MRDPVVVNVSYFFGFVDDPTIHCTKFGEANVQRGATMLFAAAKFRRLVATGQLPYERIGRKKIPLCATAYKYMFHACRIPRRDHDSYRIYDPSCYSHCIVARKGHFFSIQLVDPGTHKPLHIGDLEEQLRRCITLADSIPSSRPKLGIMTSNNRNEWADARAKLLECGGLAMEKALEKLQSGAILINLDDEAPVSRQECGNLYWTGGLKSGSNRWFDKSIEIMVSNNGKAGLIAEHSMMDGMPVINFSDYVTKMTYEEARKQSKTLHHLDFLHVEDIFAKAISQIQLPVVEELESKGKSSREESHSRDG